MENTMPVRHSDSESEFMPQIRGILDVFVHAIRFANRFGINGNNTSRPAP
jgi:hypothetical protein